MARREAVAVWTVVDCQGDVDHLKADAEAKRVEFGFAGQTCALGERGAEVLRELWRRPEAKLLSVAAALASARQSA